MQSNKILDFNPENIHDFASNIQISDLCADLSYFLVLPFSAEQACDPKNMNTIPYVVTYTDDTIKMKEIMQSYKSMNYLVENKRLEFTFKSGYLIQDNLTIRDLKLEMGGGNINGMNLFTNQLIQLINDNENIQDVDLNSSNQDIYIDQCCISSYLSGQQGFGSTFIPLIVEISLKNRRPEAFTISVDGQSNLNAVVNSILIEINKEFGLNMTNDDISEVINKQTGKPLEKYTVIMSQKLYNKSKLEVHLKNPKIQLKRIKTKDYNSYITIFKEGEKDPKKFKYSEISELTFSQLYNIHLELEESKQRKDLHYGLKINDMIIKPHQKINLAQIYFKNNNKDPLYVVGKVVNEKMVFFHTIPSLVKKGQEFILDEHIQIPKNQEEKRRSIRDKSKKRAKTTQNQYFQQQQRLQPILIYTSQLKYYQQKQKKQYKIYESLNRFLRQNPLLNLEESQLRQQWRYLYSSALLQHLKNIKEFQGKTFRGISYDPKAVEGKIITFKQFLSTSVSRKTAISFASKSASPVKHIFQLEIIRGYPIKQYSQYMEQEEILLQPFTDFQVVSVKQTKEVVNGKTFTFKIYQLKQLETSKRLPDVKANFVIWIDDKPKQGQTIFSRIDLPLETTILVQLCSTQELRKWLKKNQFLFNDPTANLIFITNMSRVENKKFNQIAGIQGLNEIRKYLPKTQVFFFIGDVDKAKKKLTDNKVDIENISIGRTLKQIYSFIAAKMNGLKES